MARRWIDDQGEAHPDRRRADAHTRWFIGVGSAAIVSLAAWGLVNDRSTIDARLDGLEARATATEQLTRTLVANQSRQDAQADARWEEIKRSLDRIERSVAVVKSRQ